MSRYAIVIICIALPLLGQSATTFSGSVRLRAEHWGWFETPAAEDEYTYLGAIARGGDASFQSAPRRAARARRAAAPRAA